MKSDDRLEQLLTVQEIDMRIVELEERAEEIPRRRKEAASEIVQLEGERAARKEALDRARIERRHRETDLQARQDRLARYEKQLNEVKTNVAYSALLTEIQTAKREIGELEEQILVLMDQSDDHERRLEEIGSQLDEKRESARETLEALEAEDLEVRRALEGARKRRAELVAAVEPELFRLYDRLRRRRRFPAIVPLKANACGACYGRLPPQVVQEITHDGALRACENCGVLIYAERSPAGSSTGADSS